ncbi:MAG: hypothetical protein KGJ35_01905 [Patescibacteria group bacterium]|nr:hypothetical protein [Patescibacteria group bacterium]
MKIPKTLAKTILMIGLVAMVVTGSYILNPPHKSHAQTITSDPFQYIISALGNALTAVIKDLTKVATNFTNSDYIYNYVLKPLAWAAAKALLQQLVNSVIYWADTGFNQTPAFIQDPTGFFMTAGDQATGYLIGSSTSFLGPLQSLCSPISLNVKLALAYQRAQLNNPYTCTLSTVINNVRGASINGFEAGDFSQGGWPAFVSLAEPQNSFYGAYLMAQSSLDNSIQQKTTQLNNELNWGQGFLSYRDCKDDTTISEDEMDQAYYTGDTSYNFNSKNGKPQRCTITTPGTTISNEVNKALGAGQDTLVSAKELDEVIGDMLSMLAYKVLQNGLSTLSQPSSDYGGNSYLQQMNTQASSLNSSVTSSVSGTASIDVSRYIGYATDQFNAVNNSLSIVDNASSTLADIMTICQNASDTMAISELNTLIATTTTLEQNLQVENAQASSTLNFLNSFNASLSNTTSASDLSNLTQQYNQMIQSGQMPSADSVSAAQQENNSVNNTVNGANGIMSIAAGIQSECSMYGSGSGTTASSTATTTGLGPSF